MISRRKIIVGAPSCFLAGKVSAFTSPYSPVSLEESEVPWMGYSDATARTLSSQTLDPSKRNCVLVIAGQSNSANSMQTPYVSGSAVDNFSIYDGNIYKAVDPLLGCSYAPYVSPLTGIGPGNFAGRLADMLINAGTFDRVILAPTSIDGSSIADWTSGEESSRIRTIGYRLRAASLPATAVLWCQGVADNRAGTTQVNYLSHLFDLIASFRGAGIASRILIAQETWFQGTVAPGIIAAQAAVVNPVTGIFAGAQSDSLGAVYRIPDNTHFTDAGAAVYASLWQAALHASGPPF